MVTAGSFLLPGGYCSLPLVTACYHFSINNLACPNRWVRNDISWCNPCIVVNESISVSSGDVMSSGHRDLDLALKWPNIIVKDGLSPEIKLGRSSNSLNSAVDWLGDWKIAMT